MAFETVNGQKVFSAMTGTTYIFGDYFAVFRGENSPPDIYEWGNITAITENKGSIEISAGTVTYFIESTAFNSKEQFLSVRAIIEGQIANNPRIKYKFNKRILPLKYLYKNIGSGSGYIMQGTYDEKVINSCNIALVSARYGRYIFLLALVLIVIIFFILSNIMGDLKTNWIFCVPISIFSGIIVSVVIYLVIGIFARHKYNTIKKADPAVSEEITIVVAPEGFAAVESFVYTSRDLIPWYEASFFIETHTGIVIIRDNKSVFWLPKNFIPKNQQPNVFGLIASRVKQR